MDWYLRFVEIEVELLWAVDILAVIYVMEFFEFYDIMEIREIFYMELWDAYNSNFEKIEGMTLVREEQDKIPAGVYHLVCEVLVKHVDGNYLLMKRDPSKPLYPNMWEATAGGSALQGESAVEGALRELREETGIISETLEQLDWSCGRTCIHCRFLCVTDCAKDSIKFQQGETCDYRWVTAQELLAMPDTELIGQEMLKHVK